MDPSTLLRAGSRGRPSPHELGRDWESSGAGSVGTVVSMVSERPQLADDVFDSILLEQADGGDACLANIPVLALGGVKLGNAPPGRNPGAPGIAHTRFFQGKRIKKTFA